MSDTEDANFEQISPTIENGSDKENNKGKRKNEKNLHVLKNPYAKQPKIQMDINIEIQNLVTKKKVFEARRGKIQKQNEDSKYTIIEDGNQPFVMEMDLEKKSCRILKESNCSHNEINVITEKANSIQNELQETKKELNRSKQSSPLQDNKNSYLDRLEENNKIVDLLTLLKKGLEKKRKQNLTKNLVKHKF